MCSSRSGVFTLAVCQTRNPDDYEMASLSKLRFKSHPVHNVQSVVPRRIPPFYLVVPSQRVSVLKLRSMVPRFQARLLKPAVYLFEPPALWLQKFVQLSPSTIVRLRYADDARSLWDRPQRSRWRQQWGIIRIIGPHLVQILELHSFLCLHFSNPGANLPHAPSSMSAVLGFILATLKLSSKANSWRRQYIPTKYQYVSYRTKDQSIRV